VREAWPWLTFIGLGLFHGVNPAMGWLFAVALGLHRKSERVLFAALLPISLGHATAILVSIATVMIAGRFVDLSLLAIGCGIALIAWACWHWLYGHRHRLRIGMTTGMVGLGLWSFIMALLHGAGLMLLPALLPIEKAHAHGHGITSSSLGTAMAATATHTAAMLLATGSMAFVVYRWVGLSLLRRAWINFDLLWSAVLAIGGLMLIGSAR
jgi:hypothetical protein